MYYRLREPWVLRGYEHSLMLLERCGEPYPVYTLPFVAFELLGRCDGVTAIDEPSDAERRILAHYIEAGVLEKSVTPLPIAPWQGYKHYTHRRVTSVHWGITGRCNCRCRHCFMASDSGANADEYSYEEALDLIAQFAECGIRNVMLTGGEPLMHPRFNDIVAAIGRAGLRVTRLYTNGIRFSQATIDMFKAAEMSPELVLSFDGLGTHDWMRGVDGAEQAAVRTMELARANGMRFRCAINVNRETLPRLAETSKYLADMGASTLFYIRTTDVPRWEESGGETLALKEYCETVVMLTREMIDANKNGLELRFFNCVNLPPHATPANISSHKEYASFDGPQSAWCKKNIDMIFLASDGRVLPCDGFEGGSLVCGVLCHDNNIHSRRLSDILIDSEYAEYMRCSVDDVLTSNAKCRDCKWWERCQGGCRACGCVADITGRGGYGTVKPDIAHASPINCVFYRGGYFERVLSILEENA